MRVESPISRPRRISAWIVALAGLPALAYSLSHIRDHIGLSSVLLLFLAVVVTVAALGGTRPAVVAALIAFMLGNYYFTPPFHRLAISDRENVIALLVFLGVALIVSRFVDAAARSAADAERAGKEARTLADLAATILDDDPMPALLSHLRDAFGFEGVALLRRRAAGWECTAAAGEHYATEPGTADLTEPLSADEVLVITGRAVAPEEHLVLDAFATRLADALERSRLRAEASHAEALAEANALRTALLQAVSHDLRTPLAAIKASASSLASPDVQWKPEEVAEFVHTIEEETDRLTTLVGNLLDMSRIQAGVLKPALGPVALDEVVPIAVKSIGPASEVVHSEVSDALPPVLADAALLERVIANVAHNAARLSPPGMPVRITAEVVDDAVDLCVIDRGPGIPIDKRHAIFEPFQRLGDSQRSPGVGLGLAVAQGFLRAMDATISIEETKGGGTTMRMRFGIAS
jgi:two-component system sensor histidine kinase KdpD